MRNLLVCLLSILLGTTGVLAQSVFVSSALEQEIDVLPGRAYEGTIILENTSPAPQEFQLYQTDMTFRAEGGFDFPPPGSHPRSNGNWIRVPANVVSVPPNSTVPVVYTLTVPASANEELSGTYWSVIMAENITHSVLDATLPEDEERLVAHIDQRTRYATRVISHFEGSGQAALEFQEVHVMQPEEGARHLSVGIKNYGDRAIRARLWIESFDASGQPAGTFEAQPFIYYPGQSREALIDLSTLPAGAYAGVLLLDDGSEDLVGMRLNLEL